MKRSWRPQLLGMWSNVFDPVHIIGDREIEAPIPVDPPLPEIFGIRGTFWRGPTDSAGC